MYLFPARNLPRYSRSLAWNSSVGVPVPSQEFSRIFPFPCPGKNFTKVINIIKIKIYKEMHLYCCTRNIN
jgi:hypothetical protein